VVNPFSLFICAVICAFVKFLVALLHVTTSKSVSKLFYAKTFAAVTSLQGEEYQYNVFIRP